MGETREERRASLAHWIAIVSAQYGQPPLSPEEAGRLADRCLANLEADEAWRREHADPFEVWRRERLGGDAHMPELIGHGNKARRALIVGRTAECNKCGATVRFTPAAADSAEEYDSQLDGHGFIVRWACPEEGCGHMNTDTFAVPDATLYYEHH